MQAENNRLKNVQDTAKQNDEELTLSDEEIHQKIAEADQNPNNISFQKNLGTALYNYASMKQNTDLLNEISRLLMRAYNDNPKDTDVVLTLGNTYFDIGYLKKDNENFLKAREYYQKALQQKPDDANIRRDYGLTYFFANPPETDKAIVEFQKSLTIDGKNEQTLQAMIQALLSQNKKADAEKYIEMLKQVDPNNQLLTEFNEQLKTK